MKLKTVITKDLNYIFSNFKALERVMSQGFIFKTELKLPRLCELSILKCLQGDQFINQSAIIKQYIKYNPESKQGPNKTSLNKIIKLWQGEIDIHNAKHPEKNCRQPQEASKETFIYLMIDYNTGLYKIGKSKNPKHREKTLQSEKPTIELIHKFNAPATKERELHKKFAEKRIRGEWFDLSGTDILYIKAL